MRLGGKTFDDRDSLKSTAENEKLDYNEGDYFESFYKVGADGCPDDRLTIGPTVTKTASRFHYNVVENAIIKSVAHHFELPYGRNVKAWEAFMERDGLRLLDIGSGSGHWIDFFRDALYVKEATGIEVAKNSAQELTKKYISSSVEIINGDIGGDIKINGNFDFISAIGVIFHITDDRKWLKTLENFSKLIKPSGLIFIGGDFSYETKNVQFHAKDKFDSWSESVVGDSVYVNKRVRSLADWHKATLDSGLKIVDVIRVDTDWAIHTPENDILVLQAS